MSGYEKLEAIVEHFGFSDLDDATLRESEVLLHARQERTEKPRTALQPRDTVEEVFRRIVSGKPYERPVTNCLHFANLLYHIGGHFGHACEPVFCWPEYLRKPLSQVKAEDAQRVRTQEIDGEVFAYSPHWIVIAWPELEYKDGSIYRAVRVDCRLTPIDETGINRTNVPPSLLNVDQDPPYDILSHLAFYDKK
jgi:hypothetical protein